MSFERVSRRLRRRVAERAHWRCEYCRTPAAFSTQPFEVDHIIPRTKGGRTILANLALSCGCNSYKGQRTHALDPLTGRRVALFNPRRQRWSRHFRWSADSLVILSHTAAGRATVEALLMNRPELVNLRRILHLNGEHPP
jgi:HNH endonuclease